MRARAELVRAHACQDADEKDVYAHIRIHALPCPVERSEQHTYTFICIYTHDKNIR